MGEANKHPTKTIESLTAGSKLHVLCQCTAEEGSPHFWAASVYVRSNGHSPCPVCSGKSTRKRRFTIKTFKEIVASIGPEVIDNFDEAQVLTLLQMCGAFQGKGKQAAKDFVRTETDKRSRSRSRSRALSFRPAAGGKGYREGDSISILDDDNTALSLVVTRVGATGGILHVRAARESLQGMAANVTFNKTYDVRNGTGEGAMLQALNQKSARAIISVPDVAQNIMLKTVGDYGDASLMDFLIESAKRELWRETSRLENKQRRLQSRMSILQKTGGGSTKSMPWQKT